MIRLDQASSPAYAAVRADLGAWCQGLIGPQFLLQTPAKWRPRLPLYLRAALHRLDNLQGNVSRDADNLAVVQRWQQRLQALQVDAPGDAEVVDLRWLLEEFRVALFAQRLGTREPVSEKRLQRRWETLRRRLGIR